MGPLKAHDQGTQNKHSHDHCLHVLRTVEASELQASLGEAPSLRCLDQRRDEFQLQNKCRFSKNGAVGLWRKIREELTKFEHGPALSPEITVADLQSKTWEATKSSLLHGDDHGAVTLGRQVLGCFGKCNSILYTSSCVQLVGSSPRFAQLIAFVKLPEPQAIIHAAICFFIEPTDHPEHKHLLLTHRSSDIALVPIRDIRGSVLVVPYFASARESPKGYTYSQFVIDVRLIWRLGGFLRIDTKANTVKRLCPNCDSPGVSGNCPGMIPKPKRNGEIVKCKNCGFNFQW